MPASQLQNAYDTWHGQMDHDRTPSDPLKFPWYSSAFTHIRQNARGKLLEVGCGRGEFALWLAGALPEVEITAVDFSPAAVEIARKHAAQRCVRIQLEQEDAQGLRFPNHFFDYVVSCECIEHVPRPQQMAQELCRVLKPG